MNNGFTITPSIITNPDGSETVSYDYADVRDHSHRIAQIEQHNRSQNGYFSQGYDGQVHHDYEALEAERYETYEPDYVEQETSEDYLRDTSITPQDVQYLQEQVGGTQQYSEMTRWAYHNLNPEWIQWYDNVMDSSDVEAMEEAVQELASYYHQRDVDEDGYADDSYDEAPDLTQDVYQYCGGPQAYLGMVQWAADNLPDALIDEYDDAMERGNPAEVKWYVDKLAEMYTANY
jgi:hypothetical protein